MPRAAASRTIRWNLVLLQEGVEKPVVIVLCATLGWQELRYSRDVIPFYDGEPRIDMDAVFFHLKLHV